MKMLVDTLDQASNDPLVWGAVGLIALHGIGATVKWLRCPYLCRTAQITRDEAEARLRNPFIAGPRFFVVMLMGIAALVAGLVLIDAGRIPNYALLLVIAGVFVVQIEPARLRVSEAVARVVASEAATPEQMTIAHKRLRDSHLWFVALNFVLVIAMVAGLAAF
ncbi:hypothetical protein M1105_00750 [Limibaculum sp. FT325]|uniref:hypothetical protein n=1 Tax=Thermohalobaculum sediminis TaxID=2939436 RepID=UPI0020BD94F2|nr:hypothetical protein [Limibaculum sediminis]MCL5775523.1 hypothetical protein [Limibaculum sediminis]